MSIEIGGRRYFHTEGRPSGGASGLRIRSIIASQRLDSRGFPTIQAQVRLQNGVVGVALVPSGASTGSREAIELRDGDSPKKVYADAFVGRAITNVNGAIARKLRGMDARDQVAIDQKMIELDGTPTKSRLGANAILAVSMAVARAVAAAYDIPLYRYLGGREARALPVPMMNVLNAGAHAGWVAEFQEKMVALYGASSYSEAVWRSAAFYHALKRVLVAHLADRRYVPTVGDEGGFAPPLATNEESLVVMMRAAISIGLKPGRDFFIALDPAASEFYHDGEYHLKSEGLLGRQLTSDEMIALYKDWVDRYPIVSIEDGLAEQDKDGWVRLTKRLGDRVQLVGDDIFVTNPDIYRVEGIEGGRSNSILIKLNQIGTVTETLRTIELARKAGHTAVISHRSGETEDPFLMDLAVAAGFGQVKTGAPARSERTAKYNRGLDIERELRRRATFLGLDALGQTIASYARSRAGQWDGWSG